ncbi:MAG: hypothetical protein AAB903_03530 [Patescibacteria group bacterium]
MFEVEFRSKFNEETYHRVKEYLDQHAQILGEDDKDAYYYIFTDKLLKVVHNVSKKTAKISLKLNRIGEGSVFPEIEFYFPEQEFQTACELFKLLNLPAKVMYGPQKRINYLYQDCEIALKFSDAWGYHLEIEQVVDSLDKKSVVEAQIRTVSAELGISLMTEEELKEFTRKAESKA